MFKYAVQASQCWSSSPKDEWIDKERNLASPSYHSVFKTRIAQEIPFIIQPATTWQNIIHQSIYAKLVGWSLSETCSNILTILCQKWTDSHFPLIEIAGQYFFKVYIIKQKMAQFATTTKGQS